MLRIEGLRVALPGFELRAADLGVAVGEVVLLQAPSGIGKTTLLRALAGLQPLQAGRLFWGDEELTGLAPGRRGIGLVFQDGALFPALTVGENAAFGLRARGAPRREARAKVETALESVGLAGFVDRRVEGLSGGERQRVAWVRALIWEPRILLLDEPFASMDAAAAGSLGSGLRRLLASSRAATVLVNHGALPPGIAADRRWTIEGRGSNFAEREVRESHPRGGIT